MQRTQQWFSETALEIVFVALLDMLGKLTHLHTLHVYNCWNNPVVYDLWAFFLLRPTTGLRHLYFEHMRGVVWDDVTNGGLFVQALSGNTQLETLSLRETDLGSTMEGVEVRRSQRIFFGELVHFEKLTTLDLGNCRFNRFAWQFLSEAIEHVRVRTHKVILCFALICHYVCVCVCLL